MNIFSQISVDEYVVEETGTEAFRVVAVGCACNSLLLLQSLM